MPRIQTALKQTIRARETNPGSTKKIVLHKQGFEPWTQKIDRVQGQGFEPWTDQKDRSYDRARDR